MEYLFKSKYFFKNGFVGAAFSYLSGLKKLRFLVGVCESRLLPCKLCMAEIWVQKPKGDSRAARIHKSVSSPAPAVIRESNPPRSLKNSFSIATAEVQANVLCKLFSK